MIILIALFVSLLSWKVGIILFLAMIAVDIDQIRESIENRNI